MDEIFDRTGVVVEIEEPGKSYETNEFIVRRDPTTGTWYAGSDGGCSCYDGFNPANFVEYHHAVSIRAPFSAWVAAWYDGVGQEAAAWEKFVSAVKD